MAGVNMTKGRPRIGLALSGGGIRGAAHIGVLQYFYEQDLPIDIIGGTSAGSIVSMLVGLGWTPVQMEAWPVLQGHNLLDFVNWFPSLPLMAIKVLLDYFAISTDWMPRLPMGLVRGNRLFKLLHQASEGKTFEQLLLPTIIPAVDIYTGKQLVFCSADVGKTIAPRLDKNSVIISDAPVALAVRASSSIPGIFQPVRYKSYLLVDGAIRNNVPADLVRFAGADFVIAVDLGFNLQDEKTLDNILEVIQQTTAIMGQEISRFRLEKYADIILQVKTENAGLNEVSKVPHLIQTGYEAAKTAWPQIVNKYRLALRRMGWQPNGEFTFGIS